MKSKIPLFSRLQVRMLVGFLLLAFVPMSLLTLYAYNRTSSGYAHQVGQTSVQIAHRVASRLIDAVALADQQLGIWTAQHDAKEAPRIYGQTFNVFALLQTRFRTFLASQREIVPLFSSILCVRPRTSDDPALGADAQGSALVLFSSEKEREGKFVFPDFWVGSANGPTVSPRYRWGGKGTQPKLSKSPFGGEAIVPIAREYADRDGRPTALVGLINWKRIEAFLAETATSGATPASGASEEAAAGDKRETDESTSGTKLFIADEAGNLLGGNVAKEIQAAAEAPLKKFVESKKQAGTLTLPSIGESFVGASLVPQTGWVILTVEPAGVAMAPIHSLRNALLIALAIVLIVVIGLSVQLAARISAPVKQLVAATQAAAGGDLRQSIPINRRDEVGELALSFNIMTEKLRESFTALRDQNKELQRLDALKNQFLANTSHELRTPIHGIIGLLEALRDGAYGPVGNRQKTTIEQATTSAHRLSNLVNQILDFSAFQQPELTVSLEPVDLRQLLEEELLPLMQGLARGKDVRLQLGIDPNLPKIQGDKDKLRQLFMNLVGNAIKFTKQGLVAISCVAAKASADKPSRVSIRVTDSGIGIPREELDAIFEPFRQVKGSDRREFGGTGLGLAIAKQVVKRHGGRIWAESTVGKGSTFFIELPVTPGAVIAESAVHSGDTGSGAFPVPITQPGIPMSPATASIQMPALSQTNPGILPGANFENESTSPSRNAGGPPHAAPGYTSGSFPTLGSANTNPGTPTAGLTPASGGGLPPGMRSAHMEHLARGDESATAEVRGGKGERILVVDDEPVNVEVLRSRLELYGYVVIAANNGMEALEMLQRNNVDLALLDVMMPQLSGYDVAARMKENRQWKDIPIIMVSAKNQLVDKIYSMNLGAVDYVTKPFQKEELLAKVRTFLDLRALSRELETLNHGLELRVAERTSDLEKSLNEIKNMHGRLVQAEKTAGLGRMAEGLAHEFKEILNTVATNLKPLKESLEPLAGYLIEYKKLEQNPLFSQVPEAKHLDPQVFEQTLSRVTRAVSSMKDGIDRGESLTQDLAVFSMTARSSGRHRSLQKVDLSRLIEGALATLSPLLRGNIIVHRDFAAERIKFVCDAGKMGRVLVHLISRSLLALDKSGELWIQSKVVEPQELEDREGKVVITIKDSGRAMSSDKLAHVFDPFYIDKSAPDEKVGLGLSIVQTFVLDHEGQISVTSREGEGTTFVIEMPVSGPSGAGSGKSAVSKAAPPPAAPPVPRKPTT